MYIEWVRNNLLIGVFFYTSNDEVFHVLANFFSAQVSEIQCHVSIDHTRDTDVPLDKGKDRISLKKKMCATCIH